MPEEPLQRRWTIAHVVTAGAAAYGERARFGRDDVKNFLRLPHTVGRPGEGPRGARLLDEDEVVAVVALLPWAASLGGLDGRAAWLARVVQLLRRTPGLERPLSVQIRPVRPGVPRDPTVSARSRLSELFPNAIHIDLRRLRETVRVTLSQAP